MEANLTLDFLPDGKYSIDLITDGDQPDQFSFQTLETEAREAIKVNMAARGGFAGVISPL
jgi:hypothetical protein